VIGLARKRAGLSATIPAFEGGYTASIPSPGQPASPALDLAFRPMAGLF